jgi:hypothetical protein
VRRGVRTTVAVVAAGSVFITGCYRFTPAETASLGVGTVIRLHLTDDGSAAVAAYVGPRMELLDGTLTEFAGDTVVVVKLQETTSRGGAVTEWAGETVRVPRRGVASADRREKSPTRTGILAAAIVVAVVVIGAGFSLFGSQSGGRGSSGSTPK